MASSDAKPQDKTASAADPKADETTQQQAAAAKKPALGEDDEFEDFPVDGTFSGPSISFFFFALLCPWSSLPRRLKEHLLLRLYYVGRGG